MVKYWGSREFEIRKKIHQKKLSKKFFDRKIKSKKFEKKKIVARKWGPKNISTKKFKVQKMKGWKSFSAKILLCPKHFELKS